jgi:uncharacterized protein YunC (DUF1805 family)
LKTAEKDVGIAAIVIDIENIDDMLAKTIIASTSFAIKIGIKSETAVLDVLEKLV